MNWNYLDGGNWKRPAIKRRKDGRWVSVSGVTVHDPYAAVDWGSAVAHKSEFHNHPRGGLPEFYQVADLFAADGGDANGNTLESGEEYTVYGVCDKGYHSMKWPWTDQDPPRDPEAKGVVAFPGAELTVDEHVSSIFSTVTNDEVDGDQMDVIGDALAATDHHLPQGLAVVGHPYRYYDDPDAEYDRYVDHFSAFGREEGLVGLEVLNKESTGADGFGLGRELPDLRLWDNLLSEFMPGRKIWGYSVDDPYNYVIGSDVNRRWTAILLEPDAFDPSDQASSRRAAMEAVRDGRTLVCEREGWDAEGTGPPAVPSIDEIAVDGDTITVDATAYDTIRWISDGTVVGTGAEITVTEDEAPYVRAEVWTTDPDAVTGTQPFAIEVD